MTTHKEMRDRRLEPGLANSKEDHFVFGADLRDFRVKARQAATSVSMQTAVYAILAAVLGSALALILYALMEGELGEKEQHVYQGSQVKIALLSGCLTALFTLYASLADPSQRVFLLDFYCFVRPEEYLCKHKKLMKTFREANYYPEKIYTWFEKLMANSGLSDETVVPTSVLNQIATGAQKMEHKTIQRETEWICGDVVENLLRNTGTRPSEVDIVITTLSCFTPTPSLAAMLVNRFGFKTEVLAYSLGGMGCSASVAAVDMAKHLLKSNPNKLALLVCHENVSNNTYTGQDPSMLITNALFRMGGAAIFLSNRPKDARRAKYELQYSQRSHFAADDAAYGCMGVQEDAEGKQGVYLKKDVVRVAETALVKHVRIVAPSILPLTQLVKCLLNKKYAAAPEFGKAFDHILLHCGGKAIVDALESGLKLSPAQTQPTRDALYRFGNTSSASTWYVLSRIESSAGVRKGARIWHLSFGGGFKVNTAVWRARKNIQADHLCWK